MVCFQTNPGVVRLRCESEIIRLFGRKGSCSCAHYGKYCLISGNSKISTLSDRRLKMGRGSTWSKEKTECLLDIWTDAHIKCMLEYRTDIKYTRKNADAFKGELWCKMDLGYV